MTSMLKSAPLKRNGGLDPIVTLGLAVALVFFVVGGGVIYRNIATLWADNQAVIHSHNVIVALDELLSTAEDAETGQRGFLLTNDPKYLDPYNAAKIDARGESRRDCRIDRSTTPSSRPRIAAIRRHVEAKVAELEKTIELRRTQGAAAALAYVETDRGKVEMDAIRSEIAAMNREEDALRDTRVAEMASAYGSAKLSSLVSDVLGVLLTLIVGFLIRRAALAREREEWLQSGHVGLGAAMLGDLRLEELGDSVLGFLGRYLGAQAGAVYIGSGDFRRISTYGVPADAEIPETFGPRDGLLGQAAAENRTLTIADVPEGYLAFGSALGRGKPSHLVISPASVDGGVNAVIELGFIHAIEERTLTLLEQASESIAVAVRSAHYRVGAAEICWRRRSASRRSCRSRARSCGSPTRNWRSRAGR